jgi:hypothetical protein
MGKQIVHDGETASFVRGDVGKEREVSDAPET